MSKQTEALKLALETLERCVATCFDRYAHEQVMSRPEHFVNQAITAIKKALMSVPDGAQSQSDEEHPAQPSKPWEGLTLGDMYEIGEFKNTHGYVTAGFKRLVEIIEAKLKEKNGF